MKVPAVLLDRAPCDLSLDSVAVDNRAGGLLAARHLLGLGRRRIACIAGPREVGISNERIDGVRGALQDAGVAFDAALCRHSDFSSAGGYAAALELLALPPGQRPDALFCCNDLMAFGALRAAAELGIAVPGQLAVVGFDDIDLASFVHPPLTSVAQNTRELGHITAACLLARIAEPDLPRQQRSVAPVLHVRGSSGGLTLTSPFTELMGMTP
jgi:LacI family transcriptional regulator